MSQNRHKYAFSVSRRLVAILALPLAAASGVLACRAQTPTFANGVALGTVQTFDITEASGIVASRQNPGVVWTHNDSSFPGSVFALSTNGALLARYYVPTAFFGDFEDIAFGPGPSPESQYLYLGDIGDNYQTRLNIRVFRFPEPAIYAYQSNRPPVAPVVGAQQITLQYPDGPFNAEALMVDPLTGDLFIATKLTNSSRIYRATRTELDAGAPVTLSFIREISFQKVSAGDISADGRLIALRRGNRAALWIRAPSQTVSNALGGTSITIPVIGDPTEPNGEALGFHATGLGYYTISEGLNQPIYFFRRTDAGVPRQPVIFIGPGAVWRYSDGGTNPGTAWREPGFNDSSWLSGPAQLGYGQGDEATVISFGMDDLYKNTTTCLRKQFTIAGAISVTNLALRVCFNDGLAVCLNGTEVLRRNLAPDATFDTPATASHSDQQNYWLSFPVNRALLRTGTNTVAVELHRFASDGPDLSFDLQLVEDRVELAPHFASPLQSSNRVWRVAIAGPVGALVTVEASLDLQQWNTASQLVLTNGTGLFKETETPGTAGRFYRLKP